MSPAEIKAALRRQDPLYAILDAGRDATVPALLRESRLPHQSLYDGRRGEELASVAPYLVLLPPGATAFERLFSAVWGHSAAVWLTSDHPFFEVRRHLRRLLTVQTEQERKLLFRFYDPRILRAFLPICDGDQATQFFADVSAYLCEGNDPETLLTFRPDRTGEVIAIIAESAR